MKIKKLAGNYGSLQEYAIDLLKKLDQNNDGKISFKEFIIVLTHDLMENSTRVTMKSDESDEVEDMAAISFVLCMRGIKKYFDTAH